MTTPFTARRLVRAGFVSRTIADLLDIVLVAASVTVCAVLIAMIRAILRGRPFALPRQSGGGAIGIAGIIFIAYLTFCWSTTGETLGKHATGVRVVTRSGRPLGPVRAALRATLCVVFPIGLVWVIVSRRNLAVHDLLVRSAVVYDWRRSVGPGDGDGSAEGREQDRPSGRSFVLSGR